MSLTYNEILQAMRKEYISKTNIQPICASDLDLRFEILASQLYSLAKKGDYILKQAFLQTATGKCLENHADIRGVYRVHYSKSHGKLRFSVNEPATSNIQIPAETICASSKNSLLRFATINSAILKNGESFVDVDAQALRTGTEYDVIAGEITTMVVPPTGIDSVVNPKDFQGGYSGESDDKLRERVINSLRNMPNGLNKQDLLDRVMGSGFVTDANFYRKRLDQNNHGDLFVALQTDDEQLTDAQKEVVANLLANYTLYTDSINVVLASKVPVQYSLSLFMEVGGDKEVAIKKAKDICGIYNDNYCTIGTPFSLFEIEPQIERIPQVHHFQFETEKGNMIFAPSQSEYIYPVCKEVIAYDR